MKKFALLLALFLLIKPFWPVIEYGVNYDYIVTVLCENKDTPEMGCDGKCYLGKQLAKEAGEDDKNPFQKSSKTEIPQVIISEEFPEYHLIAEFELTRPETIEIKPDFYHSIFSSEILDPPQIV